MSQIISSSEHSTLLPAVVSKQNGRASLHLTAAEHHNTGASVGSPERCVASSVDRVSFVSRLTYVLFSELMPRCKHVSHLFQTVSARRRSDVGHDGKLGELRGES